MATGIPKRKRGGEGSLRLQYPGKSEATDVLTSSYPQLDDLQVVPGEPMNELIYGENLQALGRLVEEYSGQVTLVYIDPPYATGSSFETRSQKHAYDDTVVGHEYLEFIRLRLILLRELLSDVGSIYVHIDSRMLCELKLIMDELFGSDNFRNLITRKKSNRKNYTRNQYGNVADYLLFYSKTRNYRWNQPFEAWTEKAALKEYPYQDESGRRYKKVPVHAPGVRNGATGRAWKGTLPPPGKHWQYTPEKLEEMDARGDIYWSPTGNPRRKLYLDESSGIPFQDIWTGFRDAHNQMVRVTGYPTEKNLDMVKLILSASSAPGDLVLDCFSGSGTLAEAAESTGRRWICIDDSMLAIDTTVKRLVHGSERMGDFVQRRTSTTPLFNDRILTSGLRLRAVAGINDPVPEKKRREWADLLISDSQVANLSSSADQAS